MIDHVWTCFCVDTRKRARKNKHFYLTFILNEYVIFLQLEMIGLGYIRFQSATYILIKSINFIAKMLGYYLTGRDYHKDG